ncbi:MAG: DUF4269 domain-containing protein [Anaerolineaceae bacterium]|nr:DUF4269 domain-containing protein [Anaerolineaceae bacterium]
MVDWTNLSYLQQGTPRQQAVYQVLVRLGIFEALQPFSPVLAGTIPLDIDLPESDLDVICEANDLDAFQYAVEKAFGTQPGFRIERFLTGKNMSVVANFNVDGVAVEVFGQPKPVNQQNAYRHMLIEARLLELGGEAAKQAIRHLKASGLKTEPAFARYFRLEGDPYQTLLTLYEYDLEKLKDCIAGLTL